MSTTRIVRQRLAVTLLLFGLLLSQLLWVGARPAQAASSPPETVRSLRVEYVDAAGIHSRLDLSFDKPQRAAQLKRQFGGPALTRVGAQKLGPTFIDCEGSGDWHDSNGKLSLQYSCNSKRRTGYLAWGYRISAGVQAIIVSNVTERGLSWWRNSAPMPQNAPHVENKNYIFHGTMTGANSNMIIEYQDYLTFRHKVGGGGTGSITWAGRVHTAKW